MFISCWFIVFIIVCQVGDIAEVKVRKHKANWDGVECKIVKVLPKKDKVVVQNSLGEERHVGFDSLHVPKKRASPTSAAASNGPVAPGGEKAAVEEVVEEPAAKAARLLGPTPEAGMLE